MRHILLILVHLTVFSAYGENIDSVHIYKKFLTGDKTQAIGIAFHSMAHSDYPEIDTTNVAHDDINWTAMFLNSRPMKHFTFYTVGIMFAGELYIAGKKHYFTFGSNNSIKDFTAHKRYHIPDDYVEQLRRYFRKPSNDIK